MRKILPTLSMLIFLGGIIALLFMPMKIALTPEKLAKSLEKELNENNNPNAALASYYVWEREKAQWAKDIQLRLSQLESKFPADYRFTLERVRGLKNQAGIRGGQKPTMSLFAEAAAKAIDANQSRNMLADLENAKADKSNGFGQLSKRSLKEWNTVVAALKTKKKSRLKSLIINRP
mgnify:CR=1 FL=1